MKGSSAGDQNKVHLLPFLEFSARTFSQRVPVKERERELETLLGPDPSATFINHSTGQNNRLLLMRLTILRRCLQCHGSWLALIQLTITESSNQHASLQSETTVKLMQHTVHTLKDHKKSLFQSMSVILKKKNTKSICQYTPKKSQN